MVVDESFIKDAGLIMEPQFNLDIFKPGTPIHVKGNGGTHPFYSFNKDCLIVRATRLTITVVYVETPKQGCDDEDNYNDTKILEIAVEKVSKQEVLITFLNKPKPIF